LLAVTVEDAFLSVFAPVLKVIRSQDSQSQLVASVDNFRLVTRRQSIDFDFRERAFMAAEADQFESVVIGKSRVSRENDAQLSGKRRDAIDLEQFMALALLVDGDS
jgi:hypothetical protein